VGKRWTSRGIIRAAGCSELVASGFRRKTMGALLHKMASALAKFIFVSD
jgi:hypothetical protein